MDNTKIRDLDEEKVFPVFFQHLDVCSIMIKGEIIHEFQAKALIEFLKSEFKDMSAEDVEDAVKKYLGKKLNCDASYCVKMSAEYLGVILSAYRVYKRENKATEALPKLKQHNEFQLTEEEAYLAIVDYIEKNNALPEWGGNYYLPAFKFADKGIINASNEEKLKFIDDKRTKMAFDLKELRLQSNAVSQAKIHEIRNYTINENDFKNHCRVEFLKKWLKQKYKL